MVEEVSGDLEHTCLSHRTATCKFTREEPASGVETEVPIIRAAEEQMKVIRREMKKPL